MIVPRTGCSAPFTVFSVNSPILLLFCVMLCDSVAICSCQWGLGGVVPHFYTFITDSPPFFYPSILRCFVFWRKFLLAPHSHCLVVVLLVVYPLLVLILLIYLVPLYFPAVPSIYYLPPRFPHTLIVQFPLTTTTFPIAHHLPP